MGIYTHLRSEWIRTLAFIPWLLEFFVPICYKEEQNRLLLFQVWTLVPVLIGKITGKAERHKALTGTMELWGSTDEAQLQKGREAFSFALNLM